MNRTVSAPGKLFLAGEYAVLWGGVARVAAVGPRLHVTAVPRHDRRVDIVLADGRLSGMATHAGVRWEGSSTIDAPFLFAARALDAVYQFLGTETQGICVACEPSPLVEGHKLGFGSSARATVAVIEAVRSALNLPFDALKLALWAHSDAQGGRGSGADVASCFAGGIIRYRRFAMAAIVDENKRIGLRAALTNAPAVDVAKTAPPRFPMAYLFSGSSASTTALVSRVETQLTKEARSSFVELSDGLGHSLELGLTRGEWSQVQDSCRALQKALWQFQVTRHEGLERLVSLAETFGCVAKQSGAGGGDGAIVFAPTVEQRKALVEAALSRGVYALPLEVEGALRGEAQSPPQLQAWISSAMAGER